MVNYTMTQLGLDKDKAEAYVENYDGMKIIAASVAPILGEAAASKLTSFANKLRPAESMQSFQVVKTYAPHEVEPLGNSNDPRSPASTFRTWYIYRKSCSNRYLLISGLWWASQS
nr:hypothetical protein [Siccibacter turicensis]